MLAEKKGVFVGSHVHPDAGNILFTDGDDWLLIDDGSVKRKRSANHNIVLFNDVGQVGEGKRWFDRLAAREQKPTTRITYKQLTDKYQYIVVELEKMYPPEARVNLWERTFIRLLTGEVIVQDRLSTENVSSHGLMHFPTKPRQLADNVYCLGVNGNYSLRVLADDKADAELVQYVIPESERKKHSNFDRWSLITKTSGTQEHRIIYTILRNRASCKAGDTIVKATENNLQLQRPETSVQIDFASRAVRIH